MFLQNQLFLVVLLLAISLVKGVTENKNKSGIKNETTTKAIQASTGDYDDTEKADYGDLAAELAKLVEEEDELNKKKNALSSENGNKNSTGKPYIQKDKSKKYLEEDNGKYDEESYRKKDDSGSSESKSSSSSDEDLDEDNLERLPGPLPHNEGISRRRIEKEKGGEDEEEEEEEKQENPKDKEGRKIRKNKKNPKDESEEDTFDGQIPKSVRKLLKQLAAGGKNPVIIPLIINNNNMPNRRAEDEPEEWNKRHGRPHRLNDWNNPGFPSPFQSSMFQQPMFPPPFPPQQQPPIGVPPAFAHPSNFLGGPLGGGLPNNLPNANPFLSQLNRGGSPNKFPNPPPNQVPTFGLQNQFNPAQQQRQPNQVNPQGENGNDVKKMN